MQASLTRGTSERAEGVGALGSTRASAAAWHTTSQQTARANAWDHVERDVAAEDAAYEMRLQAAENYLLRLHAAAEAEARGRIDMFDALKSGLLGQISSLRETTQVQLDALKPDIPARIDSYNARLAEAERNIAEERQMRAAAIEREKIKLIQQLADFQEQLQLAKVERLESEASAMQKIIDEYAGVGALVDEERSHREATLGHQRDDNDEERQAAEKPNQLFRAAMVDRMQACVVGIRHEAAELAIAERQIIDALEAQTLAIQDAVKLVNRRPLNSGPFRGAR